MPPELAWIPDSSDLVTIGEDTYLSVAFWGSAAGHLSTLCFGDKQQMRCNAFLDALLAAHNRACEEAVGIVVMEVFGAAANYARTKLQALRLRVLQEYASRLPTTVEVQEPMEEERIIVIFESDKRRRVAIKCDTETVNIIVAGVAAAASCAQRKKPRRHFQVDFPAPPGPNSTIRGHPVNPLSCRARSSFCRSCRPSAGTATTLKGRKCPPPRLEQIHCLRNTPP